MRKIAYVAALALSMCAIPLVQAQAADAETITELLREGLRADQRKLCIRRLMDYSVPLDMDECRDEPLPSSRNPRFIVKSVQLPLAGVPILGLMGGNSLYAQFAVRF